MRMFETRLPGMRTTDRGGDHGPAVRLENALDDFPLRFPQEWILYRELALPDQRDELLKPIQNSRMRRARRLRCPLLQ